MAMTHDYLDYLNQRVDIAPANSQEELQAAETIAALMSQHNLEPSIEEFDAPSLSGLGAAILAIVAFVGVLVSGFGILVLTLVGLLLAAIPAILAIMRLFGREPSLTLGPQARSQNVVAVHRATGPLVTKGSRRIVVIAHYDTPRENFLYTSPLAPYLPLLVKAAAPCSYAAAVCALVQLLGFIPAPARVIAWILGILACVPGLVVAAGAIHERMSSCTLGANDNKSGVAALLGVMENVRPSGLVPTPREPEQSRDLEEVEDAEETSGEPSDEVDEPSAAPFEHVAARPAPVEVVGVRHGEEVLRELQILPETCEIEYYVPEPAPAPAPSFHPTSLPLVDVASPTDDEPVVSPEEEYDTAAPAEEGPLAGVLGSLKGFAHSAMERIQSLVHSHGGASSDGEEPQEISRGGAAAEAARAAAQSAEPDHKTSEEFESWTMSDAPAPAERVTEPEDAPNETSEFEAEIDEILAAPAPESEAIGEDLDEPEPATETFDDDLDEPEAIGDDLDEPELLETDQTGEIFDEEGVEGTAPMRPLSSGEVSREDIMSTGRFSIVMDDESRGVGPKDTSGLTAIDESTLDIDQPAPKRPRPSAPDDPEWGKASFRPSVSNVARRATLFDLPDPEGNEVDPLGDSSATASTRRTSPAPETVLRSDAPEETEDAPVVSSPQPIETLASEHRKSAGSGFLGKLKGMFSGKGDAESSWFGSDDADGEDRTWRGGAATRSGLRLVGEDEGAPSDDELRGAALALGDEALIAHDIWFVALGGSSLDHAGMRSFLAEHRSEIRGSFVINLDCIGAGDLTLLSHEGRTVKRRADRRLGRILTNVAKDVHVELGQRDFSWTSTDAWVAMRSSLRALTIMGVGENGLPALSHTPMDDPENVSGDQTALVAEMVTEAIRRS